MAVFVTFVKGLQQAILVIESFVVSQKATLPVECGTTNTMQFSFNSARKK
jgi:hypothetical protein